MTHSVANFWQELQEADVLFTEAEVQAALRRVADELNEQFADQNPLLLAVMRGAVVFVGQLLPLLKFPLEFDFVHVSRYGQAQQGGELSWKIEPNATVSGRVVLVVDDILDEGETLTAIQQRLMSLGASKVYLVVFADKKRPRALPIKADFVGLSVPDRFVFGYGMDIHGAWRNLPAICAVKES
jgi:hypoxanthine phosphoribosyltransferase